MDKASSSVDPEVLAFYYPQFHRSPLNDSLYGEGFTEWDNVRRGSGLFPGHRQPREPESTLGYYSLDDPGVYPAQVEQARAAGISGFCFYHYWMTGGRRILEKPFQSMLASDIDFPFCLMWANHDWTMAWRGEPETLSLEMTYAAQDPRDFIADIAEALTDDRYIRIDGKPLLFIYEIDGPPSLSDLVVGLRREAKLAGIGDLFIAGMQLRPWSPNRYSPDLDALCEFPPHGLLGDDFHADDPVELADQAVGSARFIDYRKVAAGSLLGANLSPGLSYFRALVPDWDNTARRAENHDPTVFVESTPARFGQWAASLLRDVSEDRFSLPVVLVNAWNEWGEAAYLEPDADLGSAYLDALAHAIKSSSRAPSAVEAAADMLAFDPDALAEFRPPEIATPSPIDAAPVGDTAPMWIDVLQAHTAPLDESVEVVNGLCQIQGFAVHPGVELVSDAVAYRDIYLVSDTGNYHAQVPAVPRLDLLEGDQQWVTEVNVDAGGFEGWLDLADVAPGEYQLVVGVGDDRVAVAPTTLAVVDKGIGEVIPDFSIRNHRATPKTLFEPGMTYTTTFHPASAHEFVASIIQDRAASRILDCGCADGSFGEYLIEQGLEVHGLEFDPISLAKAKLHLQSVARADFESADWPSKASGFFDALLFIDVLEHVRRPDLVVRQSKSLLRDGGALIASIPNIAHVSQRLALLQGEWQYEDWGLLDRTHLRFFTLDSIEQLFTEAGMRIDRVERTAAPASVLTQVPADLESALGHLAHDPSAAAYQYVVCAVIDD